MKSNPVKAALRAGRPQVGTWLSFANVHSTRLMARIGFPWLTLDIEHSPIDWSQAARYADVKIHLYGKQAARPGRKMGHLTALANNVEAARELVLAARAALTDNAPTAPET